jgi:alpha,alpha-trehalase
MLRQGKAIALPEIHPISPKENIVHMAGTTDLLHYIQRSWRDLQRGPRQLVQAARDPKLKQAHAPWPVYVSRHEQVDVIAGRLRQELPPDDYGTIEIRQLPADLATLSAHGLLYLPHDYVVPGGRFNELYGWDSYWIVLGLLHDGSIALARNIVDNFLYEIMHYGMILNANRTYYLTRSQPPLLTGMILAVFRHTADQAWLRACLPAIERSYRYWTEAPHHIQATGLARYFDRGAGPAPEVEADEKDSQGRTHYERVQEFFRTHPASSYAYGYQLARFYDAEHDRLTPLFYTADRSMRESGFDPSDRFGRFNLGVIDINPVCLNSLLYLMERETADIHTILGDTEVSAAWTRRAARRAAQINRLMWDEEAGLYFDYDFTNSSRRTYPFLTTFYPLWAGIASQEQAERVKRNLALFEAPGGLQASSNVSGSQWDAPYGWAPLITIAVDGLRRYGAEREANRVAHNFLALVLEVFNEHDAIFEKYDVVRRTACTDPAFGYSENVVGFGWTNGAVVELMAS